LYFSDNVYIEVFWEVLFNSMIFLRLRTPLWNVLLNSSGRFLYRGGRLLDEIRSKQIQMKLSMC